MSPPHLWGGGAKRRRGATATETKTQHRVPARTCVACRQEAGKVDLIRLVRGPEGGVAVDSTGRAPGRGAYLHAAANCIEIARKRRALDRALGTTVQPEFWSEIE